jgi:hypothetical protein
MPPATSMSVDATPPWMGSRVSSASSHSGVTFVSFSS